MVRCSFLVCTLAVVAHATQPSACVGETCPSSDQVLLQHQVSAHKNDKHTQRQSSRRRMQLFRETNQQQPGGGYAMPTPAPAPRPSGGYAMPPATMPGGYDYYPSEEDFAEEDFANP